jgi:hypothetical protein
MILNPKAILERKKKNLLRADFFFLSYFNDFISLPAFTFPADDGLLHSASISNEERFFFQP